MIKLAIVGTRKFVNPDHYELACEIIAGTIMELDPDLVASGGAKGVDTWAADIAKGLGYETVIFLPTYGRWAPNGFEKRNLKIANWCTHLLAIRCKEATTYGSGWTYDRAKEMGKIVEQCLI